MRRIAFASLLVALACDRQADPPAPTPELAPAPAPAPTSSPAVVEPPPPPCRTLEATVGPTREFEIRNNRAVLGGEPVKLWGIRWGNALMSQAVTERHVRNLDNLVAHGINLVGVYLQGSNGGWPDVDAGRNGFSPEGALDPEFANRLEWLIREADARGMVVMVGIFSPRKDQQLADEAAIERAVRETASFLRDKQLRNVFVDIMHEYSHPERIEHEIFREPDGAAKKAKLAAWFHAEAPDIEVGVCPTEDAGTDAPFEGEDVRIIQKEMDIPETGFVVNVEMQRHDPYENEGKYEEEEFGIMREYFEDYREAENAALMFHSAFTQGITGKSGSGPHAEMGGMGRSEEDRGVRFWFEWVRAEVGVRN
jgi:hypothetical protein